jgi:hypothetical protein
MGGGALIIFPLYLSNWKFSMRDITCRHGFGILAATAVSRVLFVTETLLGYILCERMCKSEPHPAVRRSVALPYKLIEGTHRCSPELRGNLSRLVTVALHFRCSTKKRSLEGNGEMADDPPSVRNAPFIEFVNGNGWLKSMINRGQIYFVNLNPARDRTLDEPVLVVSTML